MKTLPGIVALKTVSLLIAQHLEMGMRG
jgi:hypothetical protein